MTLSFETMLFLWLAFVTSLTNSLPRITLQQYRKERVNNEEIIFEYSGSMPDNIRLNTIEYRGPEPLKLENGYSSSIFPDDRIYFPGRRDENILRKRFSPRAILRFRSKFEYPEKVSDLHNPGLQEEKRETTRNIKENENSETGSNQTDTPGPEKKAQEGVVPLAWLERWAMANKYFPANPSPNTPETVTADDNVNISFQSLIQVPSIRKEKNGNPSECPPTKIRNHFGDCVPELRLFLIERNPKS